MKTGPSDLLRLQLISNHSSVPLQVQNVDVAVLLVEKQSTWTFWWGIQLDLSQEPAFEVVEAETVVPTICDQHIPHAVNSEPGRIFEAAWTRSTVAKHAHSLGCQVQDVNSVHAKISDHQATLQSPC